MKTFPTTGQAIIVAGNAVDGLEFYGPYPSVAAAAEAGNSDPHMGDSWCAASLHAGKDSSDHAALIRALVKELKGMTDTYEGAIDTHIYDGDEPKKSDERRLVKEARAIIEAAEAEGVVLAENTRLFLDLSTAHLTVETRTALWTAAIGKGCGAFDAMTIAMHRDGAACFVHVPPQERDNDPLDQLGNAPHGLHVPSDLIDVLRYARRAGCDYVMFDRDGPEIAALPVWEGAR
jgi:hypothetical protein